MNKSSADPLKQTANMNAGAQFPDFRAFAAALTAFTVLSPASAAPPVTWIACNYHVVSRTLYSRNGDSHDYTDSERSLDEYRRFTLVLDNAEKPSVARITASGEYQLTQDWCLVTQRLGLCGTTKLDSVKVGADDIELNLSAINSGPVAFMLDINRITGALSLSQEDTLENGGRIESIFAGTCEKSNPPQKVAPRF